MAGRGGSPGKAGSRAAGACAAVALALALACHGERAPEPAREAAGADTTPPVIPFHFRGAALRLEPDAASPAVREAAAGAPLRVLDARGGWLRVATWDDRAGWLPEPETLELPLWLHYQQALGGAPLSDLRPAYPLSDGRWAVEAPPPSPGVVTAATVWLLGDSTRTTSVTSVEAVESTCGSAHRLGILSGIPAGRPRASEPLLAGARPVSPAAPASTLHALAPRPATPSPAQAQAVGAVADRLAALARAAARTAAGAPEAFGPAQWLALGDGYLWAALAGEPGRAAPAAPSWAAAVVVLGGGAEPEVRVVVPPYPAPGDPPAVHLLQAFGTTGNGRPTLFVVHRVDFGGERIELYVARAHDVRRLYAGYAWGC